ncbi:MAG: metal ABC transporter substrate-binding protein [Bdellovibrionales bacterium]|nr:metal ABC transporter substrate-binding protein [Bdellovibrionales bacterium]
MSWILFIALSFALSSLSIGTAQAEVKVLTSTSDLAAIAKVVGGDLTSVESVAKGTQDPHFLEAKPSFMLKTNRADLFVAVGLDLEIGWLPSILRGARNPKVQSGSAGYLEVGPLVDPLEIATGEVTRAEGDVHPLGNPHVTLDPKRCAKIATAIAKRLGEIDPPHAAQYQARAEEFQRKIEEKTKLWTQRLEKTGIKKMITYHKTLNYFFDRFGIQNVALLEPKPGIPPTSGHILKVVSIIKEQKVPLILVENFFDPAVTRKIQQEVPSVQTRIIPVSVEGEPLIKTNEDLFEAIVKSIEGAAAAAGASR